MASPFRHDAYGFISTAVTHTEVLPVPPMGDVEELFSVSEEQYTEQYTDTTYMLTALFTYTSKA